MSLTGPEETVQTVMSRASISSIMPWVPEALRLRRSRSSTRMMENSPRSAAASMSNRPARPMTVAPLRAAS